MNKKILFVGILALSVFLLSSCGKAEPKTEAEIEQELIANDLLCCQYEMADIEFVTREFHIEDRKTSSENGTDEILCELYCDTNEFSYIAQYRMNYFYYDQGWTLKNLEKNRNTDWSKNRTDLRW